MTKLRGINHTGISRHKEKSILYKKQIRKLMPKEARIGKSLYEILNQEYTKEISNILSLAYEEAKNQNRKTIFGTDIKKAIQQQREVYGIYMLEHIEVVILNKVKEMKQNTKKVKEWTTKMQ